jgi:hypothetical protein
LRNLRRVNLFFMANVIEEKIADHLGAELAGSSGVPLAEESA